MRRSPHCYAGGRSGAALAPHEGCLVFTALYFNLDIYTHTFVLRLETGVDDYGTCLKVRKQ
jgi:hypothetical protein